MSPEADGFLLLEPPGLWPVLFLHSGCKISHSPNMGRALFLIPSPIYCLGKFSDAIILQFSVRWYLNVEGWFAMLRIFFSCFLISVCLLWETSLFLEFSFSLFFLLGLYFVCLLICWECLYILRLIPSLSVGFFCNYFLLSVGCVFIYGSHSCAKAFRLCN